MSRENNNEKMEFPDTWEKFEEFYGFYDTNEVYTNGSRLIPSFRVKQWLEESESRISLVKEAVNTILSTCNTDSIADKAMRNAAKFVQNAIDGSYPDFEKLPKWIPVSEGLPEIHNYCQLYLVTYEQGQICTAFYTETNGRSWWSIDGVEAWMPLPEPYKQEVNNDGCS